MGKKVEKVSDLPLGFGEGIIKPKSGGQRLPVKGTVKQGKTGGKHLNVLGGGSFGSETKVFRWHRIRR